MKKNLFTFCLVIGLAVMASKTMAAGISVTPDKLTVQTTVKDEVKKILTVKNISATPQLYNLYSDELTEIISINPPIFRLEPTAELAVTIIIKPSASGVLTTNISVVAEDIDRRKFNAAAGVKIPLQIIALPGNSINYLKWIMAGLMVMLTISGLALVIISLIKRRRKTFWQRITGPINLLHHHRK